MILKNKDLQLLHQLDLNSRQSESTMSKKIGIHKASVNYRLKVLEKKKVIIKYYTVIDSFKLGYEVLRFYINFQYTTPDIEKEIITYFKNSKYVWALYSIDGWFDLDIIFWIKNRHEFYDFWKIALNRFGDYFGEQKLSFLIAFSSFRNRYLIEKTLKNSLETTFTYIGEEYIPKNIDKLDKSILKIITTNARISKTDLSKKLHVPRSQINYRIKKLTNLGIIKGYRVNIDLSKIGYRFFKLDIFLKDFSKRNDIINYVKSNPHLMGIIETVGFSHIELEFHLKNESEINYIINDIILKFPNAIRSYKYLSIKKAYKLSYFPEN